METERRATNLELRRVTRIFGELRITAAENGAKVFVEMGHHLVLVGVGIPSRDTAEKCRRAPSIEKIDRRGFSTTVATLPRSIEPRYQVYIRDSKAWVSIHGVGVEDSGALVGAIGVCGPEVGEGCVGAGEGEVDELGYPGVLGAVGGSIFLADGGGRFVERVGDKGVEGEGSDLDGEEIALVLSEGEREEGKKEREGDGDEGDELHVADMKSKEKLGERTTRVSCRCAWRRMERQRCCTRIKSTCCLYVPWMLALALAVARSAREASESCREQ